MSNPYSYAKGEIKVFLLSLLIRKPNFRWQTKDFLTELNKAYSKKKWKRASVIQHLQSMQKDDKDNKKYWFIERKGGNRDSFYGLRTDWRSSTYFNRLKETFKEKMDVLLAFCPSKEFIEKYIFEIKSDTLKSLRNRGLFKSEILKHSNFDYSTKECKFLAWRTSCQTINYIHSIATEKISEMQLKQVNLGSKESFRPIILKQIENINKELFNQVNKHGVYLLWLKKRRHMPHPYKKFITQILVFVKRFVKEYPNISKWGVVAEDALEIRDSMIKIKIPEWLH